MRICHLISENWLIFNRNALINLHFLNTKLNPYNPRIFWFICVLSYFYVIIILLREFFNIIDENGLILRIFCMKLIGLPNINIHISLFRVKSEKKWIHFVIELKQYTQKWLIIHKNWCSYKWEENEISIYSVSV